MTGKRRAPETQPGTGKELACRGSVLGLADGTVRREPVSLVHFGPVLSAIRRGSDS